MNNSCGFTAIKPTEAKRRLDDGSAILIDIRDPNEFAREHIRGARLVPLNSLDTHDFDQDRARGKAAIFHCQSGRRTASNAAKLIAAGFDQTYIVEGGLIGWREAGLPLHLDKTQPLELQRQVLIAAGSLVVLGVVLAALLSPWFALLSAGVGGGLIFAGATGNCALAQLLQQMPWNQTKAPA